MASYCTREDLEARIGADLLARLADADLDGAEDLETIGRAIADVDARIISRIGRRWPTYVGVPTEVLRPLAVDLVVDQLARGPMRTDDIKARGAAALAELAAIGRGDAVPSAAEATTVAAAVGAGEVAFSTDRRAFSGGGF